VALEATLIWLDLPSLLVIYGLVEAFLINLIALISISEEPLLLWLLLVFYTFLDVLA